MLVRVADLLRKPAIPAGQGGCWNREVAEAR